MLPKLNNIVEVGQHRRRTNMAGFIAVKTTVIGEIFDAFAAAKKVAAVPAVKGQKSYATVFD
jgi:hypothetical protein